MIDEVRAASPDPDDEDLYICITCTGVLQASMPVDALVYHEKAALKAQPDRAEEHYPAWGTAFNMGQQMDLFQYERRIGTSEDFGNRIASLLERTEIEVSQGLRPGYKEFRPAREAIHHNFVAIRSDKTDWPMFPEDVIGWQRNHRDRYDWPGGVLETIAVPEKEGRTYEELFTQGEFYALCVWMNRKHVGAGSQMLAGQLIDGFDEAELAKQWRGPR